LNCQNHVRHGLQVCNYVTKLASVLLTFL